MPVRKWIQKVLGRTKTERRGHKDLLRQQLTELGFPIVEDQPIPESVLSNLSDKSIADSYDPTGKLWRRVLLATRLRSFRR